MYWGPWFIGSIHFSSSWCLSSLFSCQPLHTFALLFITLLFPRMDWGSFYLFVSSLQAARLWSLSSVGSALTAAGGCGSGQRRRGRGMEGAWPGGGAGLDWGRGGVCPRSAAGGRVSGWQLLAEPAATAAVARARCSQTPFGPSRSSCPRSASFLAREGDPAALCPRTLVSQPQGSSGESQALPGEASIPERSRNARRQIAPLGNLDRWAFSSACTAGRAGRVGSTAGEGGTRTSMMDARTWRVGCRCLLLLALVGSTRSEGVQSCEEVRKVFQWRLAGAVKGLPDSPRPGKARLAGAGQCAWARAGVSWGPALRNPGSGVLLRGKMTFQALRPCKVNPGEALGKLGVNIPSAAQLRGLPACACG